jgi:transcription initiation factor IIE alpha subunit
MTFYTCKRCGCEVGFDNAVVSEPAHQLCEECYLDSLD